MQEAQACETLLARGGWFADQLSIKMGTSWRHYGGEQAMGRVTFNADGRMMAVLCDGRPSLPPEGVREYTSYCGNYTFDGTRLITRVDAASDAYRMAPIRCGT